MYMYMRNCIVHARVSCFLIMCSLLSTDEEHTRETIENGNHMYSRNEPSEIFKTPDGGLRAEM